MFTVRLPFFSLLVILLLHVGCEDKIVDPSDNSCVATVGEWEFLGLGEQEIGSIAVDPHDQKVIYAGSGSDFTGGTVGGIFKSEDCGATWDTLMRGVTVRDLDIHPTDSKIIYAALGINVLTQPGIIKTIDGGVNWTKAHSGIRISWEEGPGVLEIDPGHPDILYAGTGGPFGGSLYKSFDAGSTWTDIAGTDTVYGPGGPDIVRLRNGVESIAISPKNTNVIYVGTAYNGDVLKTSDGGENWELTGLSDKGIIFSLSFHPSNTGTVYAGAWSYGFFKTEDGGMSWENINKGLPEWTSVVRIQQSSTPHRLYIVATAGDQGWIYRSTQTGEWERLGIDNLRRSYYYGDLRMTQRNLLYFGNKGIFRIKPFCE